MRGWPALLAVVLCSCGAQARPPAAQQEILTRVGVQQRLGVPVPLAATFRDEQGVSDTLGYFLHARPAVIALVYFQCPNLCTLTLNSLAVSLSHTSLRAPRDYEVVAISIDPREGPALAAAKRTAYLSHYGRSLTTSCAGCDPGWHFLTGNAASIRAVSTALGYRFFWDATLKQYVHPAGIVVVGAQGRITQYFNGIDFPPRELQHALQLAAAGATGTLTERLWLLCAHYEALAGRYGATIAVMLRVLALATLAALLTLIVQLSRRTT